MPPGTVSHHFFALAAAGLTCMALCADQPLFTLWGMIHAMPLWMIAAELGRKNKRKQKKEEMRFNSQRKAKSDGIF